MMCEKAIAELMGAVAYFRNPREDDLWKVNEKLREAIDLVHDVTPKERDEIISLLKEISFRFHVFIGCHAKEAKYIPIITHIVGKAHQFIYLTLSGEMKTMFLDAFSPRFIEILSEKALL